ncbi:MAG: PEP-CTERM/exosortase system-associated acyltransferase [Deltaproteobacteria bacterium]|nr:PEP-CTERM/exosortase system-associated acyltransferase [Deltaproteobacteria bacterium]
MSDLKENFDKYFEVISVNSDDLLEKIYRLRYHVYCEEGCIPGFETDNFQYGMEKDEDDQRSTHCLVRHRHTGVIAGSVRLVLPDPMNYEEPLPIERYNEIFLDPELIDMGNIPRQRSAEISRFILAKEFRSRRGERQKSYGSTELSIENNSEHGRRSFPHPILGLAIAITRMSLENDITHLFAVMEPALNRLLRRFLFDFNAIGPAVECHGTRQPYLALVKEGLDKLYHKRRDLWELLIEDKKTS